MKTLKNAHNTGFLRLARPGSAGRGVSVWGEKVGRAAPALCLSLLNSPLVNSSPNAPRGKALNQKLESTAESRFNRDRTRAASYGRNTLGALCPFNSVTS